MKKFVVWCFSVVVALCVAPLAGSAATVTLTDGDAFGTSSLNSAGNWSNGLAPAAGNDYQVSIQWLRTPGSGDHVFAGDSLSINTDGGVINKNGGSQTVTVDLILNGGIVRSGSGAGDTFILDGTINIPEFAAGGLVPDQSPYVISSTVTGSGTLHLANDAAELGYAASGPGRGIDFSGVSTFTGDVTANAADMVWMNGSSWSFVIGASGVNNSIGGSGTATFNGQFSFDLSSAGTNPGDSWLIAAVSNQTFGETFTVAGFADAGSGRWSDGTYEFSEGSGILSVGPSYTLSIDSVAPQGGGVHPEAPVEAVLVDGGSQVDTGTIVLTLDGSDVTGSANISTVGDTTTVSYDAGPFVTGSVHTASVVVAGMNPASDPITNEWTFTVASALDVPASWAYPLSLTNSGTRGLYHRDVMHDDSMPPDSILPNTEARAVAQLAFKLPYPDASEIEPTAVSFSSKDYWRMPEDDFDGKHVVNMNNTAGGVDQGQGNFHEDQDPPLDDLEGFFPGIFFGFYDFADETFAFLELDAGFHQIGVNSDDGFVFYMGDQPLDLFAPDAGRFDGGRPATNDIITVNIRQAGLYPVRLLHYQGGGDASLELFTVDPDGTRVLVNDMSYGGVRAWRPSSAGLPSYVEWVEPQQGTVADTLNHAVTVEFQDGDTGLDTSKVSLALDGTPVAWTLGTTSEGQPAISYTGGLPFNTSVMFTVTHGPIGSATVYTSDFEVVTGDASDAVALVSTSPEGVGNANPVTLEVVLADRVSVVDTGSISLYFDGAPVSHSLGGPVNGTSTVSYAAGFLDAGSTHTGMVVYAGLNPAVGPFTNEWTFQVEGYPQVGDWFFVEDFEPYELGQVRNVASPPWFADTSLANIQADASSQRLATGWGSGIRGAWREVPTIDEGASGTYYFQMATADATPDGYWGMMPTTPAANVFGHEAECGPQVRLIDTNGIALAAMDGSNLVVVATGLDTAWYGVWLVVDNSTDTYDVYYNRIGGSRTAASHLDCAIPAASGLGFRNGGTASALTTFIQESLSGTQGDNSQFMDNLRYDPNASAPADQAMSIVSVGPEGVQTSLPLLEAVIVDVLGEPDTSNITLLLDGTPVTPDSMVREAPTTTVSYAVASLNEGPHTASVIVPPANPASCTETGTWSFVYASPAPAGSNLLFNVNIAGSAGGTQRTVTDGIVVKAPSTGLNQWNNLAGNNGAVNPFTILDANGRYTIGLETRGSHIWGEAVHPDFDLPELFLGWTGANAPMNMSTELSGLYPSAAYDIYLYSTWRWTENDVNYEIIEGSVDVTAGTVTEVRGSVAGSAWNDYSALVYGDNYIVFSNVTPTVGGRIVFTGQSPDGVMNGLQIVQRPGQGNPPDVYYVSVAPEGVVYADAADIEVVMVDFGITVNPGDVELLVDGSPVTPSGLVKVGATTIVTYAESLALGPHTAGIVPAPGSETNAWNFAVKALPAGSADVLWNVNFAGLSGELVYDVTAGSVVAAPSTGSNFWNDLEATVETPAGAGTSVTNTFPPVTDANGGNAISVVTRGSQRWGTATGNDVTVELFRGWGGANAPCNYDAEIGGLDTNATYDLYVFSTWTWSEIDVPYAIVEGSAAVTGGMVLATRANIAGDPATDYSGIVEGENYYVFTGITPTADGRIVFHVGEGADYVCNGFQLVQIPGPAGPTITLEPSGEAGVIRFSWPLEFGSGFLVETNVDLPVLENWNDAGLTPFIDAGNYVVTDSMNEASQNYRLIEP